MGVWLFRGAVLHKFHGNHPAQAAYISHRRELFLKFQEAVCDNLAYFAGTRSIVLFLEEIEHCQRGCTGYRVAAVGSTEGTRSWSIHDFCSSNYSADRHTCPHRLGHNQQVWFNALVFNREHSSGAAEATLNLVGNKQDAIALADLL